VAQGSRKACYREGRETDLARQDEDPGWEGRGAWGDERFFYWNASGCRQG
jgi:hypothetical protein